MNDPLTPILTLLPPLNNLLINLHILLVLLVDKIVNPLPSSCDNSRVPITEGKTAVDDCSPCDTDAGHYTVRVDADGEVGVDVAILGAGRLLGGGGFGDAVLGVDEAHVSNLLVVPPPLCDTVEESTLRIVKPIVTLTLIQHPTILHNLLIVLVLLLLLPKVPLKEHSVLTAKDTLHLPHLTLPTLTALVLSGLYDNLHERTNSGRGA
mmetsp:Transcript_22916/g.47527  ORF Transcript_22916/g.47527 Transcript_22916/m.47527 type:complete len:208 (-) Transcript_22916:236-859(-)